MTLLDCYLFLDRVLQRCRASCTLACARGTYSYHTTRRMSGGIYLYAITIRASVYRLPILIAHDSSKEHSGQRAVGTLDVWSDVISCHWR